MIVPFRLADRLLPTLLPLLAPALLTLPSLTQQSLPSVDLEPIRAFIAAGAFPSAETGLRSLIAANPTAPEPRFLLGYTLFKEQRATDSLAAYTAAAALRAPTPDDLTVVASDYVLLKDYADAARWLKLATTQDPSNAAAWYLLGRSAYNLDRPDDARQAFLACLRLDPSNLKATYNLGLTWERLHQPAEAEAAYRHAIALEDTASPTDSQPFLDLGMLLLGQEKPKDALPFLRTAVHLAESNPLAHQQLALCLEKLGLLEEAATEMARCAQLAPTSQSPPFFLGRLYHRLGRDADARTQFDRASALAGTRSAKDVPNLEPANH